jgi:hypothetical protein
LIVVTAFYYESDMSESVTIKIYYGIGDIIYGPYQQYIDYLEDVVIYSLKRELSEPLASPDPSSSAEDQCCKCSTCTCECHKKYWSPLPSPPPPPLGTTCRCNTPAALCSLGSSCTTRFNRNVAMKFLNSLRHVIWT